MDENKIKIENYTKYEIARLIGARALQIKMGAPILINVPKNVKRPLEIAKLEFQAGVLPITVKRKK
ncbi:MAG TPA: DNA-directed RNA polymerase subunit K [Candidatus Altiarchaeales archaeon]|nr:DNA-directed RNA polymerase subunit K [Candidatus Altiarchaeales archaeon]